MVSYDGTYSEEVHSVVNANEAPEHSNFEQDSIELCSEDVACDERRIISEEFPVENANEVPEVLIISKDLDTDDASDRSSLWGASCVDSETED